MARYSVAVSDGGAIPEEPGVEVELEGEIDDLEEQILQLDVKLEEQTAENNTLQTENTTYWEENRALHVENSRLAWDNEELRRKVAATLRLLTEAHAANQKLQDQLATALQDGMDLVQQLAEARRVLPTKVSSGTPPAKPAFGLLGYAIDNMRSPWEADLQKGKLTPAPLSSLTKAHRREEIYAEPGEQDQYAADATSPILTLTWTPSKLSSPTPSGAFPPSAVHGVMSETGALPGALSIWSSSPLSPLHHAPFPSTAEELSLHMQAQVEPAQLATTPLSQLLVGRRVTDTRSFMSTPLPAGAKALVAGVAFAASASAPSSLTESAEAKHQAISWGKSWADFRAQDYLAGDVTSPVPSTLSSSWSPVNFLAPTPLGAITSDNALSRIETPPPPVRADPVLKDKPSSTQTPVRLSLPTLTANANNQAEVSATVFAGKARTPLGNVTNVLDSQVTSGRPTATPTRFTIKKGLRSIFKAAVPSPLKPAESHASPSSSLCHSQTQTFLSTDFLSGASKDTPATASRASPAPLLRRSPALVAVQPGFPNMLLGPTPTPTLVRATPKLAASASNAAQIEVASHAAHTAVASQAAGQPPVVVTTLPRPHAELPSIDSSTTSSRHCSRASPQTSTATGKVFQSTASPLSRPWSIAGPNSPAVSLITMGSAPTATPGSVAITRLTRRQQSSTSAGITTRARASGRANVAQSSIQAVRAASQAATAASTARPGAPGRAGLPIITQASSKAGQRAQQAGAQAGTGHLTGGVNGPNRRPVRCQAPLTAVASNDKLSAGSGAKQSTARVTNAKQPAATSAKHSAATKAKQSTASVTNDAANRPASGTTVAGRPRAVGKTKALKAEVPTRVQPTRAARKGWR
ncbi:hypothetical protein ABBQ32_005692 [Trebouxia sp. C0010 RCD-2024]